MDEKGSGFDGCQRQEKEVISGLCLSFDMLKGICMETHLPCDIQVEDEMDTDS